MITKAIKYTDYNGVERVENCYFNLTRTELVKMQTRTVGGYAEMIQRAIDAVDGAVIMQVVDELIDKAYGVKSPDGKRLIKSPEILAEFKQTEAYDLLFMELVTNAEKCAEFVNGILPVLPDAKK